MTTSTARAHGVTTYVSVVVEDCAVYTYDEDGEETENDITPDIAAIER